MAVNVDATEPFALAAIAKESAQGTPLTSTTPSLLEAASPPPPAAPVNPRPSAAPEAGIAHSRGGGRSWMGRLKEDISLPYADLPVLSCCVVSGLCDSVAFNAGGVFVSMQTGNTIFLALGAARLPSSQPVLWLKALVSIAAFWLGCLAFSKSRHFHPRRKATLSLSFLVQSICIFVAAALAQTAIVPAFSWSLLGAPGHNEDAREAEENKSIILLPLALLAFQFGGQIVTSRILGFNEVPTNVLTSVYCDLFSDPKLLAPLSENPKRNRRLASVVLLVVGGIVGGWLQRSRAGMAAALWIAGSIKFALAAAWMGWRGKRPESDEKKAGN